MWGKERLQALSWHDMEVFLRTSDVADLHRYQWCGLHWWKLSWLGAMCYTGGVLGYNTSSITDIIHDCTHVNSTLLVCALTE